MRRVILMREQTSDEGTFGKLEIPDTAEGGSFFFVTGELPWRNNEKHISCIPLGIYEVTWRLSPRHGMCYHVDGVPGRSDVEIHSANYMGDKKKGFQCQLEGCIALGDERGRFHGKNTQLAIFDSKLAVQQFEGEMGEDNFELEIDAYNPDGFKILS